MVSDDPETSADLDGHYNSQNITSCGIATEFSCAGAPSDDAPHTVLWSDQQGNLVAVNQLSAAQQQAQNQSQTQTQTQTQPKQLSAEDVSRAIQSAKKDTGTNAKKAVDFLNSLGTNWKLNGDTLSHTGRKNRNRNQTESEDDDR
jgi:hypothetical protein